MLSPLQLSCIILCWLVGVGGRTAQSVYRMIWHVCPCWLNLLINGAWHRVEKWVWGKSVVVIGGAVGSKPSTGADEDEWANKTWLNWFFWGGGWMLYRDIMLRAVKRAGWFIVPATDSHSFTFPPLFPQTSFFNYSLQNPPFSHPCPY